LRDDDSEQSRRACVYEYTCRLLICAIMTTSAVPLRVGGIGGKQPLARPLQGEKMLTHADKCNCTLIKVVKYRHGDSLRAALPLLSHTQIDNCEELAEFSEWLTGLPFSGGTMWEKQLVCAKQLRLVQRTKRLFLYAN
jgi:hypothetical protein